MTELEFSFGDSPWEEYIDSLAPGSYASAAALLAMTEGEADTTMEEVLDRLESAGIWLDISDLPKTGNLGEAALRLRQEEQLAAAGLKPDSLEDTDPLRLYLEEVAMTSAAGDPQLLAERCAAGEESAQVALTNLGLSRVIAAAREYVGRGVLLLDLIQEGSLGLWQSVQNYRSGAFEAYSDRWIRFNMDKAVLLQAEESGLGQKMRQALEDYRAVDERLLADLGRNPTLEEIAQELHMTPDTAATVRRTLENARLLAQAKKTPEPEEEEIAETQAVEDTAYFQMRQRIHNLLAELVPEDAKLLTLRYGLEGGRPLTAEEAGRNLGMTPQEVITREAAALAKLRGN